MRRRRYLQSLATAALARGGLVLAPARLPLAGAGAGVTVLAGCKGPTQPARLLGATMGTGYVVQIPVAQARADHLRPQIEALLSGLDARMSTYRPDSEVSRFNGASARQPVPVGADTAAVLRVATDVARASDGAFDATVGPLVDLWGFGPGHRTGAVPGRAALARAAACIGQRHVRLDPGAGALVKDQAGVRLDLSGVAKGYAVDAIGRLLEASGCPDHAIDVGGEVRVAGLRGDGTAWRIGIERPQFAAASARAVYRVVTPALDGAAPMAAATSGTYRNYFELSGHRYSHSIDPRSAQPVDHALVSVTVLASAAAVADAWATALLVAGPRAARRLAEDHGLAAYFIEQRDGSLREDWTGAMVPYLARKATA